MARHLLGSLCMGVVSHPLVENAEIKRRLPPLDRYRREADATDAPDRLSVDAADEALQTVLELWGGRPR